MQAHTSLVDFGTMEIRPALTRGEDEKSAAQITKPVAVENQASIFVALSSWSTDVDAIRVSSHAGLGQWWLQRSVPRRFRETHVRLAGTRGMASASIGNRSLRSWLLSLRRDGMITNTN